MLGRFSHAVCRQFSTTYSLRSIILHDEPPRRRASTGRFERDRIKYPDTRSDLAPRNEDYFKEANREFAPRKRGSAQKRWQRREQFRQLLEAEAETDRVAHDFERQPLADRRKTEQYLEEKAKRGRRIAMTEMAQRKYYSFPIEDNLLTWKAKEQVYQLHQSDPQVWIPETLAESFPISEEGARRFLKRRWPPAPTGEDEEEVIRKHDEEVKRRWILLKQGKTEDGLVSQTTLNMIRSGQVKFLPMFAAGNSKLSNDTSQQPAVDEISSVILPGDGPFMKLYKRHLQFLEKTSATASSGGEQASAGESTSSGQVLVEATAPEAEQKPEELLRAFVFPEDEPGKENVAMQFDQFRRQLDRELKRRNRPEDRTYREWMMKKEGREGGTENE